MQIIKDQFNNQLRVLDLPFSVKIEQLKKETFHLKNKGNYLIIWKWIIIKKIKVINEKKPDLAGHKDGILNEIEIEKKEIEELKKENSYLTNKMDQLLKVEIEK